MDLFEYVGNQIREYRTQYGKTGLSQDALATKLGVATNTVSRWETATYKPDLADLEKISRALDRSILDFFPQQDGKGDDRLSALMRAANDLDESDLEELRRYAEYRKARSLYGDATKGKRPGRPRNKTD